MENPKTKRELPGWLKKNIWWMVPGWAGFSVLLQQIFNHFGMGFAGMLTALVVCICYGASIFIPQQAISDWVRLIGNLAVALYIGNILLIALDAVRLLLEY